MPKDLRTYLEQLSEAHPNHIKVVDQEVDCKWEITAFVEKLRRDQRYPEFPAVLFYQRQGLQTACHHQSVRQL